MKLFKAVRPKGYTGPIRELVNRAECVELTNTSPEAIKSVLQSAYDTWAEQFFKEHPRGALSPTFFETSVLVRGTGDNGRWLVSWWVG